MEFRKSLMEFHKQIVFNEFHKQIYGIPLIHIYQLWNSINDLWNSINILWNSGVIFGIP